VGRGALPLIYPLAVAVVPVMVSEGGDRCPTRMPAVTWEVCGVMQVTATSPMRWVGVGAGAGRHLVVRLRIGLACLMQVRAPCTATQPFADWREDQKR